MAVDMAVLEMVVDEPDTGEHAGEVAIAGDLVGVAHNSVACKAVDMIEEAEKRFEEEHILAMGEGIVGELRWTTGNSLIVLVLARDKTVALWYEVLQWRVRTGNVHPLVDLLQSKVRRLLVVQKFQGDALVRESAIMTSGLEDSYRQGRR